MMPTGFPVDDEADDADYLRFLEHMSADCRCCRQCNYAPCAGVTAGGVCDEMCWCDEGDDA
jgi:hypothetical protein